MKSLHELWTELEAWIAHFREHAEAAVASAAPASPSVEVAAKVAPPEADFSPAPPAGVEVPANKPAEPPAPQVQDETPRPVNTTDPVAPGFQAPATSAPEPAAPEAPAFVQKSVMTYAECMGQNLNADGPTNFTITDCPARVQVRATQHTGMMALPYDLTVNGVTVHQDMVLATTPINTDGPTVTVSVSQPADSHLTIGVGPAPVA